MPESSQVASALTFFFVTVILGGILLLVFLFFDARLFRKQEREIRKAMDAIKDAHLIHSKSDYLDAGFKKSDYLLFKRTIWAVPMLLIALLILLIYVGAGYGFDMTEYWIQSGFGLTAYTIEQWNMDLPYEIVQSPIYSLMFENGKAFFCIFTPILNALILIPSLWILYQAQAALARAIALWTYPFEEYYQKKEEKEEPKAKSDDPKPESKESPKPETEDANYRPVK